MSIETAGLIIAALVGLGVLARYVWCAFRFFDRLNALINSELRHNGGSSMKDQVKSTSEAVERLASGLDSLASSHEREIRGLSARVTILEG